MRDLSIRKVPGIGRVNERLLEAIGIKACLTSSDSYNAPFHECQYQTCGDIYTQRAVISLMDKQFGLMFLLRTYLGVASNVVQAHRREERKSIGAERFIHSLFIFKFIFSYSLQNICSHWSKGEDSGEAERSRCRT